VFDLTTLSVTELEGRWKDKFLAHMKSSDFFDVARFPTAAFKLNANKNGRADGELTIKGVTQPLSFTLPA
jgi:polyisoprenoid-binding protein YceI